MHQTIVIKKLHAVYIPHDAFQRGSEINKNMATTLAAAMMSYGYVPSQELHNAFAGLPVTVMVDLHDELIPILRKMKGAHVKHKPMYPNFPQQVMEASEVELFLNAITHYWSFGEWKPDYPELPRDLAFENTKYIMLDVAGDEALDGVFTRLLESKDSLSEEDKGIIEWFMVNRDNLSFPANIPFKENMCVVAGMFIKAGKPIDGMVKTATDVLRIVTYLNEGDVSLAGKTKFKSMKRAQRKMFAKLLEKVAHEEDINRHRQKWVRLFHSLHIGDYSPSLFEMAKKIRNNITIATFNGRVNAAIAERDAQGVVALLKQRPGEYARRLDHLFRVFNDQADWQVLDGFIEVADQVPTRILAQVIGHFKSRMGDPEQRVVFPKGATQKAQIIPALDYIKPEAVQTLLNSLDDVLIARFGNMEPLGKVWLDPDLMDCPVPSQQRSASEGTFQVARGTHITFGDETKNTLRFFIYWVGRDIDLSATLHDESFNMLERIAYTNLRSAKYESCHSGDITSAPHGASEFIDITIDKAVKFGARYVVMNVLVFSGPDFAEHKECFAGWMTRSKPNSNEIYDAKTVEQKVDLRSKSRNAIPVVFDLVERKAIWTDLVTKRSPSWNFHRGGMKTGWAGRGNNVESNRASIEQTVKAIVNTIKGKMSLYHLFSLHATARGTIVTEREEADVAFTMTPGGGNISPYDINIIASEFLA